MENRKSKASISAIQSALIELLEYKDLNKISITELCNKADINRTTFYKYYYTQEDVLNAIINKYIDYFKENLLVNNNVNPFEKVLNFLHENQKEFKILQKRTPANLFIKKILEINELDDIIINSISNKYNDKEKRYLLGSYKASIYGLIDVWLHDKEKLEIKELSKLFEDLFKKEIIRKK